MASIFKPKGRDTRNHPYWIEYTDENGKRSRVRGYTDKSATQQKAHELETRARMIRDGLLEPIAEERKDHERRSVKEHVEDFREDMLARNVTFAQARLVCYRINRVFALGKIERLSDIRPSVVQSAIAAIRDEGKSAKTCNDTLAAVKQFCGWARMDRRIAENPIEHLKGYNKALDRRHDRRALTDDELRKLFAAAERGKVRQGMTGQERALIYRVAALTGLRKSEIASLKPESFNLEAAHPTVTVEAAFSKHRREDEIPLAGDLVPLLQEHLETRQKGQPAFSLPTRNNYMACLQADLKAAGIPYETPRGYADFHALRHTFVSRLAKSTAPPKVVQDLARHSDPRLTFNVYGHIGIADHAKALNELPSLGNVSVVADKQEACLAATGTGNDQYSGQYICSESATEGDTKGHGRTQTSQNSTRSKSNKLARIGTVRQGDAGKGKNGEMATPTGFEPVLPA